MTLLASNDNISNLLLGDCLELLPTIADNSVDMVLCDLPYGTTACKWDSIIPLDELWKQYNRICKQNAAMDLLLLNHLQLCWHHLISRTLSMSGYGRNRKELIL